MKRVLKVATLNINKGFHLNDQESLTRLQLNCDEHDVIFLQEFTPNLTPRLDQFVKEQEAKGFHFVFGNNSVFRGFENGNALLSKTPIKNVRNVKMNQSRYFSRMMLLAQIHLTDITIDLINVHLGFLPFENRRQIQRTYHFVQELIESRSTHVILGGDFNSWFFKHMKTHFSGNFSMNPFTKTYPSWNPRLSLDHFIFHGLRGTHFYTQGMGEEKYSDHAMLCGEFTF